MRRIPAWNRSVLLLLVTVAAYFQSWIDLWPFWENKDATYTHGSLIALTAIWLVWRARPALTETAPVANPLVIPLVLVLSAGWLLAVRANMFIAHVMLWPVLAFTILWAGVGWRASSKLAFPIALLYFAIPCWDYLKPPLQMITSTMVGFLTGLAGVQAFVEGPTVVLPSGTIFIALDCSGAHFLCVALAVGALAGEFRGDRLQTRILIMAIAGLLSMVFNWLRILLIVFAYLNADLKHTLETMGHLTFGWWVFAFDLVVFYLVLRLVPQSDPPAQTGTGPDVMQPGRSVVGFPAAVTASLLLPVSSWAAQHLDSYPALITAPIPMPGATGPISPDSRWQPQFTGAAWEHRVAYIWPDGRVMELYRNEYHDQSQGKELIANDRSLFDSQSFTTRGLTDTQLERDGAPPINATRVDLVDKSGRGWSALYTYTIDDNTIANARKAQFLTAFRSLYRRPAAGLFAVAIPCVPDCAAVDADLDHAVIRAYDAYQEARRQP